MSSFQIDSVQAEIAYRQQKLQHEYRVSGSQHVRPEQGRSAQTAQTARTAQTAETARAGRPNRTLRWALHRPRHS